MNKRIKSTFKRVDTVAELAEIQKSRLTFDDSLSVEEEFLQEGLRYWLNKFRKDHSINQTELAEKLGVSQSAVCQMLKKPSRLATLSRLVTAMGGSIDVTITHNGKTTSLLFGTTNEQAFGMNEADGNVR